MNWGKKLNNVCVGGLCCPVASPPLLQHLGGTLLLLANEPATEQEGGIPLTMVLPEVGGRE